MRWLCKNVLRIPQAHEMIARYTVLDKDAKRLILLRPYQIHAIEAIRAASKKGKSILNIVENMKFQCINQVITDFCLLWYARKEDVNVTVKNK